MLKNKEIKANWKNIKTDLLKALPDYAKEIPYQIKSISIRDACIAVREAKKKYIKTKEFSEVKFKSRKNPSQGCYVPKSAISKNGIYPTILGNLTFKEEIPDDLMDSRIVYRNKRWYLCIPVKIQAENPENQGRMVALDPGIRSFLTFYSEESCGKIGEGDFNRITRLCFQLDKLISLAAKTTSKKKRVLKKAQCSIRNKIQNLMNELHHKTSRFLCSNFDLILLPTFESQQMVKKGYRTLRSKSVRSLLSFAYYRFKQFLKFKAYEMGKIVLDVCEAYTSKTCSWNGQIIEKLGGRKKIRDGEIIMDRDINGAREIFLRALVDHPVLLQSRSIEFVSNC